MRQNYRILRPAAMVAHFMPITIVTVFKTLISGKTLKKQSIISRPGTEQDICQIYYHQNKTRPRSKQLQLRTRVREITDRIVIYI